MAKLKLAIDANVFIYASEGHPEFGQASLGLLKYVEQGTASAVSSELCYLEVLAGPNHTAHTLDRAEAMLRASAITFISVNLDVLMKAAGLRRDTVSLKTPDAIHIATAVRNGCHYFVTNDRVLLKKKFARIELVSIAKAAALISESIQ